MCSWPGVRPGFSRSEKRADGQRTGPGGARRFRVSPGPSALTKGLCRKIEAREPRGSRAKIGGGRSPRALSHSHNIGRLAFAGRVLPDATHRGMRCCRSHSGTVPAFLSSGIFRVRPLRPVRFHLPMVNSPDGCWHACNVCVSHQHLATGTAPAFGRALAPALSHQRSGNSGISPRHT